jgi:hypothetical protein
MKTTNTNRVINAITNTAGRFFGLETKNEIINARFVSETPQMIIVHDRNTDEVRKFAKTSVVAVSFQGRTIKR